MKLNRLLTAGLILAGITVYVACRKADRQMDRPAAFTENGKFFSNHRTADPTEAAIVDFIKRKNAKSPFIDKVISQIGYPYWDKIMSFKKPLNTSNERGNTGDSASIYYIPFVRDSQSYVNASLMINHNRVILPYNMPATGNIKTGYMAHRMLILRLKSLHCFLCYWITVRLGTQSLI
jgi:hypothetical protein